MIFATTHEKWRTILLLSQMLFLIAINHVLCKNLFIYLVFSVIPSTLLVIL